MKIIVRHDDGTEIDVTEPVKVTYDCIRQSLDWGSGFLDTEEVNHIVLLSEAAGFPDFERLVQEVWVARNRDLWRERTWIGTRYVGDTAVVTPEEKAALLDSIHSASAE